MYLLVEQYVTACRLINWHNPEISHISLCIRML
jgi:hypothetical protein